jgi:dTDP-4-amino-4,6-dideoxygalactose transaminase
MVQKVRFVDPAKLYRMIKDEIDAAYFEVMNKGDLIDRGQLRQFEENLAAFVGTKYAVGLNSGMTPFIFLCGRRESVLVTKSSYRPIHSWLPVPQL